MTGTVVLFADTTGDQAAVYVHGDALDLTDLFEAFSDNEEKLMREWRGYSNRFDDPEYLAARFVAWMLGQTKFGSGVAVVGLAERGDFTMRVLCTQESRPRVAML